MKCLQVVLKPLLFATGLATVALFIAQHEVLRANTADVIAFWDHCYQTLFAMDPGGAWRQPLPKLTNSQLQDVSRRGAAVDLMATAMEGGTPPQPIHLYVLAIDRDASGFLSAGSWIQLDQPGDPEPAGNPPGGAVFSPDGSRIAFLGRVSGSTDFGSKLYVADTVRDPATQHVTGLDNITFVVDLLTIGNPNDNGNRLTATPTIDFAPDGRRLVAEIYDDLWILELAADGPTLVLAAPLTRTRDRAEQFPRWSPVADIIAYAAGPFVQCGNIWCWSSDTNIYSQDVATLATRRVTTKNNQGGSGRFKNHPSWSLDGVDLVYSAEGPAALGRRGAPCNGTNSDIFRIRADGTQKAINLTNTSGTGIEAVPRWGW